jgi:hypothetical protein
LAQAVLGGDFKAEPRKLPGRQPACAYCPVMSVCGFDGKPSGYRKLQPLFLGMIVGTTFSSIFWILVKIASYSGGEQGKAILFLPS